MAETWFTADTHFSHRNVALRYRGFATAEEMDEALVAAWNAVVHPGDTVYHLGDVTFANPARTEPILRALHGDIHLVVGNHDQRIHRLAPAFASIGPSYLEVKVDGRRIVLCHYPIASWNQIHRGAWHLHGHTHGTLPEDTAIARMDVGVDTHPELRPWHLDEIAARLATRTGTAGDHHRRNDDA